MDDACFVRSFECFSDLLGNRQGFVQRDRPFGDAISQGWPFNQFEDERLRAFGFLDPVDVPDVGVVQRGENLCLPLEPRQPIRI